MDNTIKQGITEYLEDLKSRQKPLIGRKIAESNIVINLSGGIYAWINIDKKNFILLEMKQSSNSASQITDKSLEDLLKDFLESRFI